MVTHGVPFRNVNGNFLKFYHKYGNIVKDFWKGYQLLYYPAATEDFTPAGMASLYFTDRYLISIYNFMSRKRPVSLLNHALKTFPDKIVMMDSGVYSLLYKGKLVPERVLIDYTHKYIEVIQKLGFTGQFMEVDCQYIEEEPGTYEKLRKLYTSYGVSRQVIYVWHFAEGTDVLFDMLRKYDRVALSPKEIRMFLKRQKRSKEYKTQAKLLFNKIQKEFPNKHVHLLGTMLDWLTYLPHNWTCDSMSWASGLMFGYYFLEKPLGYDFRDNDEKVSPAVRRRVDDAMPELMRIYRSTPVLSKRQKLRVDSLRKLCMMMLSINEWWEAETLRNLGDVQKPTDPLNTEV